MVTVSDNVWYNVLNIGRLSKVTWTKDTGDCSIFSVSKTARCLVVCFGFAQYSYNMGNVWDNYVYNIDVFTNLALFPKIVVNILLTSNTSWLVWQLQNLRCGPTYMWIFLLYVCLHLEVDRYQEYIYIYIVADMPIKVLLCDSIVSWTSVCSLHAQYWGKWTCNVLV